MEGVASLFVSVLVTARLRASADSAVNNLMSGGPGRGREFGDPADWKVSQPREG
jgi:hypothetical protein